MEKVKVVGIKKSSVASISSESDDDGVNGGKVAGIIIACVVVVIALIALFLFLEREKGKPKPAPKKNDEKKSLTKDKDDEEVDPSEIDF